MLGLLVLPIPMALVLALLAGVGPVIMLHRRRGKRLREFQMQLPGTLNLLVRFDARRLLVRAGPRVGRQRGDRSPRGASCSGCSPSRASAVRSRTRSTTRPQRMTSVDLMWAVMAIRIQREVGGNLAELLDTVADTMTQRERLRLEIKALTAEGRFSGVDPRALPARVRAASCT